MDREQAIKAACEIVALAYHAVGDYTHASDGFCHECPQQTGQAKWAGSYRNDGIALDWVRRAVVERIEREGMQVPIGFDRAGRTL